MNVKSEGQDELHARPRKTRTRQTAASRQAERVVYHLQRNVCGKARCKKCQRGEGHGPYWYEYRTHDGHTKRYYQGKSLPPNVRIDPDAPDFAYPLEPSDPSYIETPQEEQTVPLGRVHALPLVGRTNEWGLLLDILQKIEAYQGEDSRSMAAIRATRETLPFDTQRSPQCVLLTGETGIGKTRLAEELALLAQRRGWTVLWSRIYSQESNVPYRTWIELLRRALEHERFTRRLPPTLKPLTTLLPDIDTRLKRGLQDGQDTQYASYIESLESRAAVIGLSSERERLRIQEAVREVFELLCERQPVLLVLDDLQWADASSCELLGYLARHIYGYPIMLLGTYRENEQERHPLQKMLASMKREHTVLAQHIDALSSEEIGQLVTYATQPTPLPETTIRNIQLQASGNPFFAEELARSGSLLSQPTLPSSIASTLDHRIGRLSTSCQQLLGHAAVLGHTFELPVIIAVEGSSEDDDTLFDLLEEAISAHVLTEESQASSRSRVGEIRNEMRVTYSFWHPLLASHLYKRNSAARRTRIHERAALFLQRMYKGREEEVAATIVHHLIESKASADEIIYYATIAGNRAYALSAFTEAMQHYRVALERVEQQSSIDRETQFAYLLERLAECSMILGQWIEARSLFERLLTVRDELTRTFPIPVDELDEGHTHTRQDYEYQVQALIWGEISRTWRYQGNQNEARRRWEQGEAVLREHGIDTGLAWAKMRYQLGGLYAFEGRFDEAMQATHEALTHFERHITASSHPTGTYVTRLPGTPEHEESLTTTRIQRTLLGDPIDIGRVHMQLSLIATSMGEGQRALTHANAALSLFERYDQTREIAHVRCNIGHLYLMRGEYEAARYALQPSLALAERIGDEPLCSVIYSNLAKLAALSAKPGEAEVWYRRAISIASEKQDRDYENRWNVDFAAVLQQQGKQAEAQHCLLNAFRVGWHARNNSWLGNALTGIAAYRLAQAHAASKMQEWNTSHRYLTHAAQDIQRALALDGLETQTRIQAQLVSAQLSLARNDSEQARTELQHVLQVAHSHKLVAIERQAQQLLDDTDTPE